MRRARGAAAGAGGGAGRRRALLQLLGLALAGALYCLLLAATALQTQPRPRPPLEGPGPGRRPPANTSAPAPAEPPPPQQEQQQQQQQQEREAAAAAAAAAAARDREQQEYEGDLEDDLEVLEEELEARRRAVWATCEASGLGRSGQPNAWEFFIDSRHGLVWCNVFKAASTAWMYNFNLLAGYKASFLRRSLKTPLALARARFPRPSPEQLQAALPGCLSFLIVREPFERLLSAYRNKLEGLRSRYYGKLGRDIARRYPATPAPAAAGANATTAAKGPSFSQFVQYVIQTGLLTQPPRFDEHWAPYYRFCTPCHVNFTVIAKVETLERDQRYIIRRAGLEGTLPGPGGDGPPAETAGDRLRAGMLAPPPRIANRGRGGRPTAVLVRAYYSQLTRTQLRQLLKIYGTDFDMFGYNYTTYYDMVRPDPPEPAVIVQ